MAMLHPATRGLSRTRISQLLQLSRCVLKDENVSVFKDLVAYSYLNLNGNNQTLSLNRNWCSTYDNSAGAEAHQVFYVKNNWQKKHVRWMSKKSNSGRIKSQRLGISPNALDLIEKVMGLPDDQESVSKELDLWVESEPKFPIAYVKQALLAFKQEKRWSRIIQVSKWMLQKGEGKTLQTYEDLLQALDMNGNLEESEAVWKDDILNSPWSIPTRLVSYVLDMFVRHDKPLQAIKLYTKMEMSGRKFERDTIVSVARAYGKAGFIGMRDQLHKMYNIQSQGETHKA